MTDDGHGVDAVDPRISSPEEPTDADVPTRRTVQSADTPGALALQWLLLKGNRAIIAGGLVVGFFVFLRALVAVDLLVVSPSGFLPTLLASGLASGLLTLITIALSINQLILSRVFGSPGELTDRLDGTRDLRRGVERIAGQWSTPNDPASFLRLVAVTLAERARALEAAVDDDADLPEAFDRYVADVTAYAENVENSIEDQSGIVDVLEVILGTEYAENLTATHHFRNRYGDRLSEEARAEFAAVAELLEDVATARQFFKTLSLQQDFGRLSRTIAILGFLAFVTLVSLTLIYRENAVTVPAAALPWIATGGLAIVAAPLAWFVSYLVRAATIARQTVSVGPFVPPGERSD